MIQILACFGLTPNPPSQGRGGLEPATTNGLVKHKQY